MVITRRSQTEIQRSYQIGDRVEVVRTQGVVVGTLLRKTKAKLFSPSSSTAVTHWIVSVNDSNTLTEDISERMLGRVLTDPGVTEEGKSMTVTVSESENAIMSMQKAKGSTQKGNIPVKTCCKSTTKVVDRRVTTAKALPRSTGDSKMQSGLESTLKLPPSNPIMCKRHGESVLKVAMFTGTLFLYRGQRRRAEFVRTK